MKIRYIKVLRELTADLTKNFMLIVAIAIGVLGIGTILGSYAVVIREMTGNYTGTLPASATIEIEGNISTGLVDSVRKLPGIKKAERHATHMAKMKVDDKWYPLLLFVVDDFRNLQTNKFNYQSGAADPPERTMLAERTAFGVMQAKEGDAIMVKTADGPQRSVKLTGTVHDPGLAPAWQQQAGYGYITLSTLRWLGETQGFDELKIRVAHNDNAVQHINEKAKAVATWLEKKGYKIHAIQIPPPDKHPHQGQMNAVMSIFIIFSFMILILGSILVATSMATLMAKQVRQIGVMKTIGASAMQITGLYLFMMLILCVAALAIAIPLSQLAASVLYTKISFLLNLEITDNTIPYWVLLVQISTGIIIPLITAAFPVVRGSRIPIRVAMDNYGVSHKNSGTQLYTWLRQMNLFGETFTLSLRNVFRQRSRLVMALGLLAAGGAMFMTARNISAAWDSNLLRIYTQRFYDLEIRLNSPTQAEMLVARLKTIAGVKVIEGWHATSTSIANDGPYEIAHTYPDKGHGSFTMQALPVPTKLLNPTLVEGQWLNKSESNDVVLNQLARAAGNRIGDSISLTAAGKTATWKIIGFTEDVGTSATAYVSIDAFSKHAGTSGSPNMLRVAFKDRRKDYISGKTREIETLLDRENISVRSVVPVWLLHNAVAAHMRVLVNTLSAMAILMALVGTLGLMSTMSMNVMERTREIGVMRAIGATPQKISTLILWEGLTIGALSILLALPLSLVLSTYIGHFIGNMAFRTPLTLTISVTGCVIWTSIMVAGAYIATYYPASRANKITTREALAYE